MPYRIEYSPDAEGHLRALTAAERSIILDAVDEQLVNQPTAVTRNRKRMRPNLVALYELRVRDLRVFYDAEEEPEQLVLIRAVGRKDGNRFIIGEEEVVL
jgi:mRNA-degrading endonuclease RelE of RelBE toxin-antitoxin system